MEQWVQFWPIPGELDIHTQDHAQRVLLLALKIGEMRQLDDRSMIALCHASIFHDTRRKDNLLDVGHGARAADYYKQFCAHQGIQYLPEASVAMAYHDHPDQEGEAYVMQKDLYLEWKGSEEKRYKERMRWLEVYRDFKDSDALDRLRLGPWMLNPQYLRSAESHHLIPYAMQLLRESLGEETLRQMWQSTRQWAEKMSGDWRSLCALLEVDDKEW